MDAKTFEIMLDRLGADFSRWPAAEAEQARKLLVHSGEGRRALDALQRVETLIHASRPQVPSTGAQRVVNRALAEIAAREAAPSLLERFRWLLAAPVPRAAFAMSLTAIGFAIGIAIGNPTTRSAVEPNGSGFLMTSADDVLF
jgi:hypothetical protein